jgi:hypothetical protein
LAIEDHFQFVVEHSQVKTISTEAIRQSEISVFVDAGELSISLKFANPNCHFLIVVLLREKSGNTHSDVALFFPYIDTFEFGIA